MIQSLEGHKENQPETLLTVPCGYFKEDSYFSMLLSFHINEKNELCMSEFTTDS